MRATVAALAVACALGAASCTDDSHAALPEQADLLPLPPPEGHERTQNPRYSSLPAFRDAPFADELQVEQLAAGGDLAGRFTTVSGGERATYRLPSCACSRTEVWLFGGSAAFGIGQRDEHTIASELVRLGEEHGMVLDVRNFGQPGETVFGEARRLAERLESEPGPPDVVIFYDGFNDTLAAVIDGALEHELDGSVPAALIGEEVLEYVKDYPPLTDVGGPDAVARTVAERYRRVQRSVADSLDGTSTEVEYFFQPDAFDSEPQMESFLGALGYERDQLAEMHEWSRRADLARSLAATAEELSDDVVDLRNLFRDEQRPVFAGVVHTNELGARLSAEAIFDHLWG